MHATTHHRVAPALASTLVLTLTLPIALASAPDAWAGGRGGGFHRFGGFGAFRGGYRGGFHGGFQGGPRLGGGRGLPPVAGVIHEGGAGRPYFSAYGHTNTGARFGAFPRGGVPGYGSGYGRGPGSAPTGGYGSYGAYGAYGHANTGLRYAVERRFAGVGFGRRRFAAGRGFGFGYGGGFAGGFGAGYGGAGYGGAGYGGAGYGGYGDGGVYGQPGTYGGQGTYSGQGTYGQPGTYGGQGTYGGTATQFGAGDGGFSYRSETPLAARYAEPPLGPSPYAPYSPGDRYAYAASADVGPGPRVANPFRAGAVGCACGPRREPTIYRYGVGTAY